MKQYPLTIKFSKDYPKLPKHPEAILLYAKWILLENQTKAFLDYDTTASDGTKYPLPKKGKYLMLLFKAGDGALFTTLRRWTQRKQDWYYSKQGKVFQIKQVKK